jgi:hypothetical protein
MNLNHDIMKIIYKVKNGIVMKYTYMKLNQCIFGCRVYLFTGSVFHHKDYFFGEAVYFIMDKIFVLQS